VCKGHFEKFLLKWILAEQTPADEVANILRGMAAKIASKATFKSEVLKFLFDHVDRREISGGDNTSPERTQSLANR
jgi:hypothetical protein